MSTSETQATKLTLTQAEALVLFEFLSRFDDTESLSIAHPSEERVLWNLCAQLESLLPEPFQADYSKLLDCARERVIEVGK